MLDNFRVEELVSKELYEMVGDNAIKLFDQEFLRDIDRFVTDVKRDLGVRSVVVNDWLWKGGYNQSGFRELTSSVGSKNSVHKQGGALDLKFKGCTIEQAYKYLMNNQGRYPNVHRVEDIAFTSSWLHVDNKLTDYLGIYVFKP